MEYEIDIHTHTLASGHAYSTIQEQVAEAARKGLKGLGITEHAPMMPGSCQTIYFHNLRIVPRQMYGIRVLLGVELNVWNAQGEVDLDEDSLRRLDVRIASFHKNIFPAGSPKELKQAIDGVMRNPYVDILGHPDDGNYAYDYEQIAQLAAEYHKIVEINNASLRPTGIRPHAFENDVKLLEQCKKCKVPVLMGSDAHISFDVGAHEQAISVIRQADYPLEDVLNYDMKRLLSILESKSIS